MFFLAEALQILEPEREIHLRKMMRRTRWSAAGPQILVTPRRSRVAPE